MKSLNDYIRLVESNSTVAKAATQYNKGSDLEVPDTVSDFPAFIKHKNNIIGYSSAKGTGHDASLVQKWLNSAGGYNLKVDGQWGDRTSAAMSDMMNRAISGEFKDKIPAPKTHELPSNPNTSSTDALRKRAQQQSDKNKKMSPTDYAKSQGWNY